MNFIESRKLEEVGYNIQKRINCRNLLITLGEHGMALFRKGKPVELIRAATKEVYDVTGAGDTVIATMTLALSCGVDAVSAARLANQAAGVVVSEVGTATIKFSQLKEYMPRL
jgi:bifunctional ADP-heptose synthase (sugar kinase/adenylyltransferase)